MRKIKRLTCHTMRTLFGILAMYMALCGVAQAACAPSANGATIPSAASLCDNANNVWAVKSGVIWINGVEQVGTQNVIVMLFQDGVIYQENSSRLWWKWVNNNAWMATPAPESLSGATIPQSPQLNDSNGNYWTVTSGVIWRNGVEQVGTQNVVLMLYYNRVVYQKNAAGGWWKWVNNNSWLATTDPRGCVPSPDSSTMPNAASLCDSATNIWTVVGGVIWMNGVEQVGTQNVILMLYYNGIVYQKNSAGNWWKWVNNNTWVATIDPRSVVTPPPAPVCTPGMIAPVIGTQAAWDQKYNAQYGSSLPNMRDSGEFAWHGHYWVRAYVSMAKTYGSTKYLDTAVRMIDQWINRIEGPKGWSTGKDPSQMSLETAMISDAITLFAYEVWKDQRFGAYRSKADGYIARVEPILNSYNNQWAENLIDFAGSPSFYLYASCGGVCGRKALMYYNQGAVLAKGFLLIDRVKRLKGQTPDPAYLNKAAKAAAYFKTFAKLNGTAYVWNYEGARTDRSTTVEDTNHAHLDLSLLVWAKAYSLGGFNDTDMNRLAATMHKVLNGQAGPNDVSNQVNGAGWASTWDRSAVGYDWIDLVDYDATLLDKTIKVFNTHIANPNGSRFYLGWAEIQRKRSCVSLY